MALDPYRELGVGPGASADEIRAAYRREARRRHPDAGGGGESMAKLNAAYAVLSDPAARAAFDRTGATGEDQPMGGPSPRYEDSILASPAPLIHGLSRRLPWVAALLVLAFLFVFSAYAGGPDRDPPRPSSSSPVGRCLEEQPALDAFVDCRGSAGRVVVAEVAAPQLCPASSDAHVVRGRRQIVCLRDR